MRLRYSSIVGDHQDFSSLFIESFLGYHYLRDIVTHSWASKSAHSLHKADQTVGADGEVPNDTASKNDINFECFGMVISK